MGLSFLWEYLGTVRLLRRILWRQENVWQWFRILFESGLKTESPRVIPAYAEIHETRP
jgi:hypothetical protein